MEVGEGGRSSSRAGRIQQDIKYSLPILLSLHLVNTFITVTTRFKIHGNKQSQKKQKGSNLERSEMTRITRIYFQKNSYRWDSLEIDNVPKLLPRLNINPNFASPQLLLLACILRCLYSITLSQEFPLCLCGRHCI